VAPRGAQNQLKEVWEVRERVGIEKAPEEEGGRMKEMQEEGGGLSRVSGAGRADQRAGCLRLCRPPLPFPNLPRRGRRRRRPAGNSR
jgi:hypothetical protein